MCRHGWRGIQLIDTASLRFTVLLTGLAVICQLTRYRNRATSRIHIYQQFHHHSHFLQLHFRILFKFTFSLELTAKHDCSGKIK
jgi:hypothetical protein